MQLFITDFGFKGEDIVIDNPEILNQARKVLRLQKGDHICVQNIEARYELEIKDRDNKQMIGEVIKSTPNPSFLKERNLAQLKCMFVAMPNKWDKIELITQKLTEIGIDEIVFWPSERSIIKQWNEKKEIRLEKIIREATEQSWGWTLPNVRFSKNIEEEVEGKEIAIFDKTEKSESLGHTLPDFGLVGPEGGLTPRDYAQFKNTKHKIYVLGNTILRTETAAIVGGWIIKNGFFDKK